MKISPLTLISVSSIDLDLVAAQFLLPGATEVEM